MVPLTRFDRMTQVPVDVHLHAQRRLFRIFLSLRQIDRMGNTHLYLFLSGFYKVRPIVTHPA